MLSLSSGVMRCGCVFPPCAAHRQDENMQLREDLKGAHMDIESYKQAIHELLGRLEEEEAQREGLEHARYELEAQKRDLLRELGAVRMM